MAKPYSDVIPWCANYFRAYTPPSPTTTKCAHDAEVTAVAAMESLKKAWGDSFDANLAAFHNALAATGEHREFIGNAILRAGPSTAAWAIKRLVSRGRNAAR